METKVYLFNTGAKAEELFKEFINRTDNGGIHKYRWNGQTESGSFDLGNDRIYCMTHAHFKKWEKTNSGFTTANGDGIVDGLFKRRKLDEI